MINSTFQILFFNDIIHRSIKPDKPRFSVKNFTESDNALGPLYPSSYRISIEPLSVFTYAVIMVKIPRFSSVC